jgi:hypothetical protein
MTNTKKIDLKKLSIQTTSVRNYGGTFFAYGNAIYNNTVIDLGDPFPSSKFPKYEGAFSFLCKHAGATVTEKDFRALFKGIKGGAEKYSNYAEILENRFQINFE